MSKRIYISGKISNTDPISSRARFEEAEKALQAAGFETVNPWKIKPDVQGEPEWADHIVADLQQLRHCDGLCMLENWHTSRGANIENYFALGLGIPVFFAVTENKQAKLVGLEGAKRAWDAKDNPKPIVQETTPTRGRRRRGL